MLQHAVPASPVVYSAGLDRRFQTRGLSHCRSHRHFGHKLGDGSLVCHRHATDGLEPVAKRYDVAKGQSP